MIIKFIICSDYYYLSFVMAPRKKSKKQPKSPLKEIKRAKRHGMVKNAGPTTLQNMEKRAVLNFIRKKHPEMKKADVVRYTGFSKHFVSGRFISKRIQCIKFSRNEDFTILIPCIFLT